MSLRATTPDRSLMGRCRCGRMKLVRISKEILGGGLSGGVSVDAADVLLWETSDYTKPITSISAGRGRVGAGYGLGLGMGQYTSTTFATPTIGSGCECN